MFNRMLEFAANMEAFHTEVSRVRASRSYFVQGELIDMLEAHILGGLSVSAGTMVDVNPH